MLFWSLVEPPGWITAVTPLGGELDAIGEGKASDHARAVQVEPKTLRLFDGLQGIDSARLAGAAGEKLAVLGKDHGVGLGVLDELEGKQQVGLALWALDVVVHVHWSAASMALSRS